MIEFYLLSIMVMTEMNLLYPRDCIERSNHGFIWGSKSFNISLFLLAKVQQNVHKFVFFSRYFFARPHPIITW